MGKNSFQFSMWDSCNMRNEWTDTTTLSILYVRFPQKYPERAAYLMGHFQFSMWDSMVEQEHIETVSLSFQFSMWDSLISTASTGSYKTFNSLCEIQHKEKRSGLDDFFLSFNSLCEIHIETKADSCKQPHPFNSLCEILRWGRLYEPSWGGFQFSMLDSALGWV